MTERSWKHTLAPPLITGTVTLLVTVLTLALGARQGNSVIHQLVPAPTVTTTVTVSLSQAPTADSSPEQSASPGPYDYEFEFAEGTFFDFDTQKAALEGGAHFEAKLDLGRFFHGEKYGTWQGVRVVYIKDANVSYSGCENGTDLQAGEVAHLNKVEQDESICVGTSGQKWAALKIVDDETPSSGNITFGVRLLAR